MIFFWASSLARLQLRTTCTGRERTRLTRTSAEYARPRSGIRDALDGADSRSRGAAGHQDWTCAKKMTEHTFQSYKNVYDVVHGIILRDMSLREGFNIISPPEAGASVPRRILRSFGVKKPEGRALMRLFCLGTHRPWKVSKSSTRRLPSESRRKPESS